MNGYAALFVEIKQGCRCGTEKLSVLPSKALTREFKVKELPSRGLRKCSDTHYIRLNFLEQFVLGKIHRLTRFAAEYEGNFIRPL